MSVFGHWQIEIWIRDLCAVHPADQPVKHYRGDNVVIGIPPTPPTPVPCTAGPPTRDWTPSEQHWKFPILNTDYYQKLYAVPVGDVAECFNQICTQTTAGLIPQPGIAVATKVNQQVYRHNKWLAQCSTCLLFISFCKLLFFLLYCCIYYMCVCVGIKQC